MLRNGKGDEENPGGKGMGLRGRVLEGVPSQLQPSKHAIVVETTRVIATKLGDRMAIQNTYQE